MLYRIRNRIVIHQGGERATCLDQDLTAVAEELPEVLPFLEELQHLRNYCDELEHRLSALEVEE